ncbi:hypothetical protein ACFL2K_03810 [Candidatus Margulisiibacteriota bacterium]
MQNTPDLNYYYTEINNIAIKFFKQSQSKDINFYGLHDYFCDYKENTLKMLSAIKQKTISKEEIKFIVPYLEMGIFDKFAKESIYYWAIYFDVLKCFEEIFLKKDLEPYNLSLPLFKKYSELFDHTYENNRGSELIDISKLVFQDNLPLKYCIFKYKNSYLKGAYQLNPYLVKYLKEKYPKNKFFVRINPYKIYDENPVVDLMEKADVLRPPNPKWMSKMFINIHKSESFSYSLSGDIELASEKKEILEYRVNKLRSLQGYFYRDKEVLTGTIEEIKEIDENTLSSLLIHFTSTSSVGTNYSDAIIDHIDLALQYYKDEDKKQRLETDLHKGKRIKTKDRVHLFRIEKIKFEDLKEIVYLCCESEMLPQKWIDDQYWYIDAQ